MEATAASIAFIQFGGQICKYIVKGYQIWEEIQDLPAELADHIAHLKAWEPIFREIEANVNNRHVLATIEPLKRAKMVLQDMTTGMSAELASRRGLGKKVKAIRIILKKETLQQHEKKLQRAIALLQTSLTLYQALTSRAQPDVIASQVTLKLEEYFNSRQSRPQQVVISNQTTMTRMQPQQHQRRLEFENLEDDPDTPKKNEPGGKTQRPAQRAHASFTTPGSLTKVSRPQRFSGPSKFGRYAASYAWNTGAWEAYIQFPHWISETIYELNYAPSLSGWMFNARIYNVIPDDSEIIKRVKMGDGEGVMELFQARKASPFDKDRRGQSLLYHATSAQWPDICQLLLSLGLHELLDAVDDKPRKTPLAELMDLTARWQKMNENTEQILQLFQSYIQDPETIPVERMFQMGGQLGYTDLRPFRTKFMMDFYKRPVRDRLEAVRLGCFVAYSSYDVLSFYNEERDISGLDIAASTKEKLSLIHSAAVGLARKLPEHLFPSRGSSPFQYFLFDDGWYDMVASLASRCSFWDLHTLEEVTPWDTDPVPVWKGTPLTSLIGGVLCFLSPDYQYYYWDFCLQNVLRHWLTNLQKGGVDLVRYGKEEQRLLRDFRTGIKGTFDADNIRQSRTKIRKFLPVGAAIEPRYHRHAEWRSGKWAMDDTLWRPIRLLGLEYGSSPADWRLLWAPETECLACQFWQSIEEQELQLPGSWVE
ncbi:hypothetical protein HJFPF1_01306 [Paramyrothecium foliicola]|nr:hypothetical protein HJFPF1_01306 [Paramyrothecium foliicola]